MESTTTLATVKQEVRLREWAAQVEAQQTSGLTVGSDRHDARAEGLFAGVPALCCQRSAGHSPHRRAAEF